MKKALPLFLSALCLLMAGAIILSCQNKKNFSAVTVFSPDSSIQVKCGISDSLSDQVFYSITYNDQLIIKPSGIEIDFKNRKPIRGNLKIVDVRDETVNETWDRVWGKRATVNDHYNQLKIQLAGNCKAPEKDQPLLQGL